MLRERAVMNFIENLKRLMSNNDVSAAELARAVGVSRSAVNGWLRGAITPRVTHLAKMADFFKISIDELVSHGEKTPEVLGIENIITAFGREYTRLDSDKRVKLDSIQFDNESGELVISVEWGGDVLVKEYGALSVTEKGTLCRDGFPGDLVVRTV